MLHVTWNIAIDSRLGYKVICVVLRTLQFYNSYLMPRVKPRRLTANRQDQPSLVNTRCSCPLNLLTLLL